MLAAGGGSAPLISLWLGGRLGSSEILEAEALASAITASISAALFGDGGASFEVTSPASLCGEEVVRMLFPLSAIKDGILPSESTTRSAALNGRCSDGLHTEFTIRKMKKKVRNQ